MADETFNWRVCVKEFRNQFFSVPFPPAPLPLDVSHFVYSMSCFIEILSVFCEFFCFIVFPIWLVFFRIPVWTLMDVRSVLTA